MAKSYWLVNSNRSRVKRFIENTNNKDQFFKYMFIDSGKVTSTWGKEPPVMTNREELKKEAAREDLRLKGGAIDAYVNNIRAIRESNPELIGKFNKVITSDDKPNDKEYYVTEEGEFVRYDKETDSFLQPWDEGFAGPKKKKK